ncbi:hypothetical protein [Dyadobacter arcticus]|uniref:Flavorubredoxin n=1 Tax=Dyadobacter arcticus TaxID=1078754 RepID=A0ABX0UHU7_9BACT|nr:hypothetical protein [Dyadobacter arcticus]NIJ52591.1 flavorubredoxin [Dyadobacter arcticus]
MKKIKKVVGFVSLIILVFWVSITLWAEGKGPKKSWSLGNVASPQKALIVYDPDPLYNLDEQISRSLGQALADKGMHVRVVSVKKAMELENTSYTLYVFCANTYNWRPDWALSNFIDKKVILTNKNVVAITLGSGSTEASQQALEKLILSKGALLFDSRSLWLLKPNDESKPKESNVAVSVSMAYSWGQEIAGRMAVKD